MMNKKLKLFALGSMLAVSTTSAHAILADGALLDFDDGVGSCQAGGTYPSCTFGATTVLTGSYFAMDLSGNAAFEEEERVVIKNAGTGFYPGVAQVKNAIDNPWDFANSTGRHHTSNGTVPAVNIDGTVNMNGWTVFWNGGDIDMGTGAAATIACTSGTLACADGETFTLTYEATVPSGGFAGVKYQLYLEGMVRVLTGSTAPTAIDDNLTVNRASTGNALNILVNDTDPEANIDISSIVITAPLHGTATAEANGTVTYNHDGLSLDDDTFTYTVEDIDNNVSSSATVTLTIQNVGVLALPDTATIDKATETSVPITVTVNDLDGDGFGIDTSSVIITQNPTYGSFTEAAGVITYTHDGVFVGTDTLKYTVDNLDSPATTSNETTVSISVSDSSAAVLNGDEFLLLDTGNVANASVKPAAGEGSWFSMEVISGAPTYTALAGFNHLHLGAVQLANSYPLSPNIDQPWSFVGNTGVHQTTAPITVLTDSGGNVTLDFSGWDVSWNAIASIPLGEGDDNGIATMSCYMDLAATTQGTCAIGDQYVLDYRGRVPNGDPSGFGNVNYTLHLEGEVALIGGQIEIASPPNTSEIEAMDENGGVLTVKPGTTASAAGSTAGINLTASEVGRVDPLLNPKDGEQCFGGCIDVTISGLTTDYADVIFRLNKPLVEGLIYRKLINGKWGDFDLSGSDLVGSNADNGSGVCTDPLFDVGLRSGAQCVFLRIYDGGPNDADGIKNGVVVDPSGALLAGSPNVPASSTSGCSVSNTPASIVDRADWLLVAAFLVLLGLVNVKRRKLN